MLEALFGWQRSQAQPSGGLSKRSRCQRKTLILVIRAAQSTCMVLEARRSTRLRTRLLPLSFLPQVLRWLRPHASEGAGCKLVCLLSRFQEPKGSIVSRLVSRQPCGPNDHIRPPQPHARRMLRWAEPGPDTQRSESVSCVSHRSRGFVGPIIREALKGTASSL